VDSLGMVQGVAPGSATIRASIDGVQATATVAVSMLPVASVSIAPAAPALRVGESLPLAATLFGGSPNAALAPAGYTVVWSITGSGVASLASNGVVTGSGPGTAVVTVRAWAPGQPDPATASVTVTVR
jgi:trimeric autotransporter adhesin